MLISILLPFLLSTHAESLPPGESKVLSETVKQVQKVNKPRACPVPESEFDRWAGLPECRVNKQNPRVYLKKYPKHFRFGITPLGAEVSGAITKAFDRRTKDPNFSGVVYFGNGPIYGPGGAAKGYVKSGGKVISKISCDPDPTDGNWGKENGVFIAYRPRARNADGKYQTQDLESPGDYKFRVISTRTLCNQCGLLQTEPKKWESEGEDLIQCDQIDFAIQSGPAILLDGKNRVPDLKGTQAPTRSFVGVMRDGSPVTVDVDGQASLSCIATEMEKSGITGLLHRDSTVVDVAIQANSGDWNQHYPNSQSGNTNAASLLVIKNR
jgi:hypothetical protein